MSDRSASPITVRYAATDDEIIAIHRFLCVIAGPTLPGPIDAKDSVEEIWRVAHQDVALMAMRDDVLVGTMGLVCPASWWNHKVKFLANRWAFVIPGSGAWRPLMREAKAIAVGSAMELHIISEWRGKISIFNRSKNRDALSRSMNQ